MEAAIDYMLIPLSQQGAKNAGKYFARVDKMDYRWLIKYKWIVAAKGNTMYAFRLESGKKVYMHRHLLRLTDPKILTDHKNHNGLDNRRKNIRIATAAENCQNTSSRVFASSQFLGVAKHRDKWRASIKNKNLGTFNTETQAAIAYDKAAKEKYGDFANLNFPNVRVKLKHGIVDEETAFYSRFPSMKQLVKML